MIWGEAALARYRGTMKRTDKVKTPLAKTWWNTGSDSERDNEEMETTVLQNLDYHGQI